MTLGAIERKARNMSKDEFFSGYHKGPEFHRLDYVMRGDIIAEKFNLTREEFLKIPGTTAVSMMLEAEGNTYMSGTENGIAAAQQDARFNSIRSYFAGFSGAYKLAGLGLAAAALGTLYIFRRPILKTVKAAAK